MSRPDRGPGDRAGRAIHAGLTGARALVGTPYLTEPALRAAYDRDLSPRSLAAMGRILGERAVDARVRAAMTGRRLRAVDLGCGTGAIGAALDAHFGAAAVERTSVDRHVVGPGIHNLDLANPAAIGPLGGGYDLVVAAHLLNELFLDWPAPERPARLARLVRAWADGLLAPTGLVVLIEPALRETSRDLLQVRDRLLATAGLRVVAPCFYQGPCPALERERDWCHDAAPAVERRRRVDFSYLVLAWNDDARTGPGAGDDGALFRVVSDPLHEKGKLRLFVCGPSGRQPLVRLHRHAAEANADLGALERGDVARIPILSAAGEEPRSDDRRPDGLRVGPDWRIERVGTG